MKCFYHSDLDGKCAGAIVYWHWQNHKTEKTTVEMFPINYNQDFPFDKIQKGEQVYIVDFSLQKEGEFEKLFNITKAIIWIDHHKTSIEKHKGFAETLIGIRKDGVSGCELTWEFFYGSLYRTPTIVKMLGRYDVWDFSKYGDKLNALQCGIRLEEDNPENEIWKRLFVEGELDLDGLLLTYPTEKLLYKIIDRGIVALRYRDNQYASLIKAWSFFAEFEGYKAICCNAGSVSSQLFDSVKEDYDLMIPFVFDGKQWTVSLYTKKDIDCSEIAKKYGGGGHKQASGFQCKDLPFRKS